MDFWKQALEAAEKAKSMAKVVSQKGMEFAEATVEEAGKKLKELGLHDAVGGGSGQAQQQPAAQELAAYGITTAFTEHIRSLNYATFRDFPADQLPQAAAGADPPPLNAWQLRHAKLVVRAVGEVNELRYVLCPRYMTDQRFWAVYFALVQKQLPEAATTWAPGDELPPVAGEGGATSDDGFMSLAGIGGQLRTLSSKLQAAATQSGGPAGLELTALLPGSKGSQSAAGSGATGEATGLRGGDGGGSMLQADPDLEAYLQVGGHDGSSSNGGGGGETGEDGADGEDLDLDRYLDELSAEVGEGSADEDDAVDVDAALRELAEGEAEGGASAAAAAGDAAQKR